METKLKSKKITQNNHVGGKKKLLVSIVCPLYNEGAILERSLNIMFEYLDANKKYGWELILVNDGSSDNTAMIAEQFAINNSWVKVVHHSVNLNLGNALKTGFRHSTGNYVVTIDIDMSYSVDHIGLLLDTLDQTQADMVLASPYMKGGRVTAVPFMRKWMSKLVNRMMSFAAQEKFYTFTSMVRAYKGEFIRSLNLKTKDYEINPEIIYKALIMRARIIEIPAHLDWSYQNQIGDKRVSGMRIWKGVLSGLMSSFIFRPYIFYFLIGLLLFGVSLYVLAWIFVNISQVYPLIDITSIYFDDRFSEAVATVFRNRPHSFLIGGFLFVIAIQFISMGLLSLQSKRYFEEIFHISTSIKKQHIDENR